MLIWAPPGRGSAFDLPTAVPVVEGGKETSPSSHKTGCDPWRLRVPSYSTHWMGLNTTPSCDSWRLSTVPGYDSKVIRVRYTAME